MIAADVSGRYFVNVGKLIIPFILTQNFNLLKAKVLSLVLLYIFAS